MQAFWSSVSFRIALVYGALIVVTLAVISGIFYYGTVVGPANAMDQKLVVSEQRLSRHFLGNGLPALRSEVGQLLADGIDQDTEVYLLLDPAGHKLAGNLDRWPAPADLGFDTLTTEQVLRYGKPSLSRLVWHRLPDGAVLAVGNDTHYQQAVEKLVWRSLLIGGGTALLLAIAGALLFRRQIGRSIGRIRRTAMEIQAGDLSRRIPVGSTRDEFALLSHDINAMLDRIEHLMDGVRHVSNTIAHNLRTPLARIRSRLDEMLRQGTGAGTADAVHSAIQEIDSLTMIFEKLLQIAEAESGARRQSFEVTPLAAVVADVTELYDAMADTCDTRLVSEVRGGPHVLGDKDLLCEALANLVENSIKYAGRSSAISISAAEEDGRMVLTVEDRGPGIPADFLGRVTQRFYRGNTEVPGSGLGLSIVTAIAQLHRGSLQLQSLNPGLRARIVLPRPAGEAANPADSIL